MKTTENKIRAARKAAGLSQEELAEKIGVTQTHISRWERSARMNFAYIISHRLPLNGWRRKKKDDCFLTGF